MIVSLAKHSSHQYDHPLCARICDCTTHSSIPYRRLVNNQSIFKRINQTHSLCHRSSHAKALSNCCSAVGICTPSSSDTSALSALKSSNWQMLGDTPRDPFFIGTYIKYTALAQLPPDHITRLHNGHKPSLKHNRHQPNGPRRIMPPRRKILRQSPALRYRCDLMHVKRSVQRLG